MSARVTGWKSGAGRSDDHRAGAPVLERPQRVDVGVLAADDADLVAVGLRVGLAAADADPKPLVGHGDVLDVEGDQLAAAERGPEAEQEERPVAGADAGLGVAARDQAPERGGEHGLLLGGSGAQAAADALDHLADLPVWVGGGTWPASWWTWLMAASRRWMVEAALPVRARWVT